MVVHANADDVVFSAPGERHPEQRGGGVASVDVKIFKLGAPLRRKHPFDAGTDCPTGF
jgi:hypothetical protein